MDVFANYIVDCKANYNYDTTNDWTYSWTFPKALLFTITIMTTIGNTQAGERES